MSCWGSLHRGAAHGSTCAAVGSSSSSSDDEEDEEEDPDEEDAEEVEEEEEDDGEGSEGRGGRGCFLGRPRRLLQKTEQVVCFNTCEVYTLVTSRGGETFITHLPRLVKPVELHPSSVTGPDPD